jgi:3-oxoacyl-(acyl-carrier-protein) synthase
MKRVAVTGIGVIAPNGEDVENFYINLINGKSAIALVKNYNVDKFNSKIAAQALFFDPVAHGIPKADAERMDRYVQFTVAAAKQAVIDSGIDFAEQNPYRCGTILANAICGTRYMETEFLRVTNNAKESIDPSKGTEYLYDAAMFNTPSAELSQLYNLMGCAFTVSTGCTAGTDSLGCALELIREGRLDIAIAGAGEAPITPITFGAFDVVNVLSKRNGAPAEASRPFEAGRDGFVLSEGAGILILESEESVRRRGVVPYCELLGFASTNNAYHMTDLPSDGDAMASCIKLTLDDAQLIPEKISYISAHGSSTHQNDVFETNAYKKVFGDNAHKVPISSIKSMIGHPLAAANAIESVLCSMIFLRGILPPTINHVRKDPQCDLDYIPNKAREKHVDYILKTSSGFSGIHSSIVFGRWRDK